MQVVRMFELLPAWEGAALAGQVGVEQTRLIARVAANPRVHEALVARVEDLLDDAAVLSFDEFERQVRQFARLADPIGAKSAAEKNHDGRDVTMRQLPDGSWRLYGRFGSLQGADINEILAHFTRRSGSPTGQRPASTSATMRGSAIFAGSRVNGAPMRCTPLCWPEPRRRAPGKPRCRP